jgi:hypothetical protein
MTHWWRLKKWLPERYDWPCASYGFCEVSGG